MRYCALASGSNGNCYYVSHSGDAVLIDVGINCKQLVARMLMLDLNPYDIKAIFVTHEHSDHIRGISVFAKRFRIPVFLTKGTYEASRLALPSELIRIIAVNDQVHIGDMKVTGIPKYHDAKEPCSFVVSNGRFNVSILTDIGRVCENIKHVVQHSDVLFLEANYDEEMLENGRYPFHLKKRIRGGFGHISNRISFDLVKEYKSERLQHLILSHLSEENNRIELVQQTFDSLQDPVFRVSIATRYQHTDIFEINSTFTSVK